MASLAGKLQAILLIDDSASVRSRAKIPVCLAAVFMLLLKFEAATLACSCSFITPQEAFERADGIFRGRVSSVDRGYLRCMWAGVRYAVGSIFGGGSDRDVESGCEVRASFELVAVGRVAC